MQASADRSSECLARSPRILSTNQRRPLDYDRLQSSALHHGVDLIHHEKNAVTDEDIAVDNAVVVGRNIPANGGHDKAHIRVIKGIVTRHHRPSDSKHVAVIVAKTEMLRQLNQRLGDRENDRVKVVAVHQQRKGNQSVDLFAIHDYLVLTETILSHSRLRIFSCQGKN